MSQAPKHNPHIATFPTARPANADKETRMNSVTTASTVPHSGVVHESEVQRQHARVRMPGIIEIANKERSRYRLHDLSASGFSFDAPSSGLRQGENFKGNLIINLDQITLTFGVSFHVRSVSDKGRVGCGLQNLGQREIAALRHLITSYLSGDVVNVGEVLHTLSRENFTAARPQRNTAQATGEGRMRAALLSSFILVAGVFAAGYAAKQLHNALFVSVATAAKVAGPLYTIAMPREGTFYSLVPADGIVKKGAPIGSYEAPVLDLVRSQAINANLTPDQMDKMLRQTVKGTITSPCDCRVQTQLVADAQYVNRGQALFELAPRQFKSFIVARFRHDEVGRLSPGTAVSFRVSGDSETHSGRIAELRVPGAGDVLEGGGIIALIEPSQTLPNDLVNRPVELSVGGLSGLPELFNPTETATAHEAP